MFEQSRSKKTKLWLMETNRPPTVFCICFRQEARNVTCLHAACSRITNGGIHFSVSRWRASHASTIFPPCPLGSTHSNSSSSCNLSSPCSPRRTMYNLFTRTCRLLARRGMYNASYLRLSRREDNNATYLWWTQCNLPSTCAARGEQYHLFSFPCQVAHQATYVYDLFPAESLGQALYLDSTLFSEM